MGSLLSPLWKAEAPFSPSEPLWEKAAEKIPLHQAHFVAPSQAPPQQHPLSVSPHLFIPGMATYVKIYPPLPSMYLTQGQAPQRPCSHSAVL